MKVLLVTGTRRETRAGAITRYLAAHKPDLVIVGDCKTGVDRETRHYCLAKGVPLIVGVAAWTALGRAAGPKRNATMGAVGKGMSYAPDSEVTWVAVPDDDSVGTYNAADDFDARGLKGEFL